MIKITNNEDFSKIYYNVSFKGLPGTTTGTEAKSDITRTIPILEKSEDYYLALSRFSLDASLIPILIIPIVDNQSDPNLTPLIFTLRFSSTDFSSNVIYVPDNNLPVPPSPIPTQNKLDPYYHVFTYETMIEMFNGSLSQAFGALKASFPASPPTEAPYLFYNEDTERISLITQYSYSVGTTIEIFMSNSLIKYLEAMRVFFDSSDQLKTARFIIKDTQDNAFAKPGSVIPLLPLTPDYLQFQQEYNVISLWSSFKDIIFLTESLPIRSEFVQTPANVAGNNNFRAILTDFSPLIQRAGDQRSLLHFFGDGKYRLINLRGNEPLYRIDFKISWVDIDNNIHPFFVKSDNLSQVKFAFLRKDTFTS